MRKKPPHMRYATESTDHKLVSQPARSRMDSGKSGFFGRFLEWIAKGAGKYNMGGASCPS